MKAVAVIVVLCVARLASGQVYTVEWRSISPGGPSGGGPFGVWSSIGQGLSGVMAGGGFSIASGYLVGGGPAGGCDTIDFNGDGLWPDTADIDDYLSVFSGGPCSTGTCGDIDFNNDGLFPDTADIDALLSVFSGGGCL
ncbi:MAG: hypothetical protein U0637_02345 [Phycisphaerales bacterium]